jgi:hypothetical protein
VPDGTDIVNFVELRLLFSSSEVSSKVDDQPFGDVAVNEIVPLNLPIDEASMVTLLEFPARVGRYGGYALIAKSAAWFLE